MNNVIKMSHLNKRRRQLPDKSKPIRKFILTLEQE